MARWRIVAVSATLFDLDGVLVDSRAAIAWSMTTWAAERRLDPGLVLEVSDGRRDIDTVARLLPGRDPNPELARIAELDVRALPMVRAIPGAAALVSALPADAWAVVTSGPAEIADARLRVAGLPRPSILIGAEDVAVGKPDPECYLLAAAKMEAPLRNCVVFEDSAAGLCAGRRAGARVVRVGREALAGAEHAAGGEHRYDGWVSDLTGVQILVSGRTVVLSAEGSTWG